jgi:hypothetical protein
MHIYSTIALMCTLPWGVGLRAAVHLFRSPPSPAPQLTHTDRPYFTSLHVLHHGQGDQASIIAYWHILLRKHLGFLTPSLASINTNTLTIVIPGTEASPNAACSRDLPCRLPQMAGTSGARCHGAMGIGEAGG